MLNEAPESFKIYWAFKSSCNPTGIDIRISVVRFPSVKYLKALYSSEFVITNSRTFKYGNFFHKKRTQKYIMTWHGPFPLKKIEKDSPVLDPVYLRNAMRDSRMCDLMLSNSVFFTKLIRDSFWYKGEILQKGIPRNDICFDIDAKKKAFNSLCRFVCRDLSDSVLVMYAPTFRDINSIEHYKLNWPLVINAFEKSLNKRVFLLFRIHPNIKEATDISFLKVDNRMLDVCDYSDMQELLCVTDVLITDYSSTMFDVAMMKKPCLIYADDIDTYNRGFYFDINKLPFPVAQTESQLVYNIQKIDLAHLVSKEEEFMTYEFGLTENGTASKSVVDWMISKMKK